MEKRDIKLNERPSDPQTATRKVYKKPRLQDLGDVRAVTLGGSPGINESGAPTTRKNRTPPTRTPG